MLTDIEIAQQAKMKDITEIASSLGISSSEIDPYGHYKAKISDDVLNRLKDKKDGKLILVTAVNPTPAGEGKTTVSIGLGQSMAKIGKNAIIALREPSLGPVFGIKGGAAGGGYSQVVPMEDINLHFTGDMHAITSANNLMCAMLDNSIQQGNELNIDPRRVQVKRCLDMNDRALRNIINSLGGKLNGIPREDHFCITVASEVMAILCLANDIFDLKKRLGDILVAYTYDGEPVYCRDIKANGAMTVLLKEAIKPNLVQTLENTPAIMHGGPFANIAHGCNSVRATKTALKLADYTITEAGFGSDLGAEKFLDIKCRNMGILPDLVVLVATCNGLKMHGDVDEAHIKEPNLEGLRRGFANLDQHVRNLRQWKRNIIVAFNRFVNDTDEEVACLVDHCRNELGLPCVVNDGFMRGGEGARELAQAVVDEIDAHANKPEGGDAIYSTIVHADGPEQTIKQRIEAVVKKVYHAASVTFTEEALSMLEGIQRDPYYWDFPVCIAKTQFSFSDDPKKYGCPSGFNFTISDIVINRGAHFIVAIAGKMMRMPGLPKLPAALHIRVEDGKIVGLS